MVQCAHETPACVNSSAKGSSTPSVIHRKKCFLEDNGEARKRQNICVHIKLSTQELLDLSDGFLETALT